MLPLCAHEGVGAIVWSPLARGRLTRAWEETTPRSKTDAFGDMLYVDAESDRAIVEALGAVAAARGVSRAQVALAWLRRSPVVAAPIVGASKTTRIDDAVASLAIELTDDEVARLEAHYTPRHDFQGISDAAELARIAARVGIKVA
jgi:aryl-alcohol dehydrogenase-like predicted oxidoreductase